MKFRRFFGLADKPGSKKDKIKKASRLHGQVVKYVTERIDGVETIIGKGGNTSVKEKELLVFSSGDILFRSPTDQVECADLLSGDGVVLKGPDSISGASTRTITVFFVYYRS